MACLYGASLDTTLLLQVLSYSIILGVIPANQAFNGFAHPAVITVALVLIISQGLKNSGLTGLVGKLIGGRSSYKVSIFNLLLFIAAILSSFINNIGALAILFTHYFKILSKMELASI
jgi:Na+/H+ antiporter NhaD/arsenite permease-like protein